MTTVVTTTTIQPAVTKGLPKTLREEPVLAVAVLSSRLERALGGTT